MKIYRNVDFFNLLTYDYHASTEPAANHHAPLKAKDAYSEYDYKSQLNIVSPTSNIHDLKVVKS